eukprot:403343740
MKPEQKTSMKNQESITPVVETIIKPPRITFNAFNTQYSIIKDIARKEFGWRVISQKDPWAPNVDWDIQWTDLAPPLEKFPKIKPYQKINHFPGMFNIARKNYLARNLKKMKKQFPADYKFFPKTWLLPYELMELKNVSQNYSKKNVKVNFIVKPECMSQGKGIFITRKVEQINPDEHLVVQKYMRNPYLIDGYKFDLRIYVLVTNVQPLRIFMHHEGLARFASEKYKLKAFNNPFIHLTNYAINKDNENFTADEKGETGHKRSLQSIFTQLEKDGLDIPILKEKMHEIIVKTLISIQPDLVHQYRTSQPGDLYNNMCFEILGFDIILDQKGRPQLLEVNHAPSFNDDTPLDKQVKRNLLIDTFRLLNITMLEKLKLLDVLKSVAEQRIIGVKQGSKQLQSIQRQDIQQEKLRERDAYELQNLGGYDVLYPPMIENKVIDLKKFDYYKLFSDHAKKFMMDFKVSKQAQENLEYYRLNNKHQVNQEINKLTLKQYKAQTRLCLKLDQNPTLENQLQHLMQGTNQYQIAKELYMAKNPHQKIIHQQQNSGSQQTLLPQLSITQLSKEQGLSHLYENKNRYIGGKTIKKRNEKRGDLYSRVRNSEQLKKEEPGNNHYNFGAQDSTFQPASQRILSKESSRDEQQIPSYSESVQATGRQYQIGQSYHRYEFPILDKQGSIINSDLSHQVRNAFKQRSSPIKDYNNQIQTLIQSHHNQVNQSTQSTSIVNYHFDINQQPPIQQQQQHQQKSHMTLAQQLSLLTQQHQSLNKQAAAQFSPPRLQQNPAQAAINQIQINNTRVLEGSFMQFQNQNSTQSKLIGGIGGQGIFGQRQRSQLFIGQKMSASHGQALNQHFQVQQNANGNSQTLQSQAQSSKRKSNQSASHQTKNSQNNITFQQLQMNTDSIISKNKMNNPKFKQIVVLGNKSRAALETTQIQNQNAQASNLQTQSAAQLASQLQKSYQQEVNNNLKANQNLRNILNESIELKNEEQPLKNRYRNQNNSQTVSQVQQKDVFTRLHNNTINEQNQNMNQNSSAIYGSLNQVINKLEKRNSSNVINRLLPQIEKTQEEKQKLRTLEKIVTSMESIQQEQQE